MNFAGAETSPQRFSPNVAQNLNENEDGTKVLLIRNMCILIWVHIYNFVSFSSYILFYI